MFNLYTDAINPNGFISLVSKNNQGNSKIFERDNRKIITSFAVVSLIILSAISNGAEFQQSIEQERMVAFTNSI